MKKIFKIFVSIVAVIVVLFAGVYAYLGGFRSITIEEKQMGPFHVAYRDMAGPDFSKVGEITTALEHDLRNGGFNSLQPFDLFFPDGGGEIGFLVEESDTAKISSLDSATKIRTIPAQQCMVTTFPWKNPMSYIVGFSKVDHAFKLYREKKGYRKTWAATRHDTEYITYLQPIKNTGSPD